MEGICIFCQELKELTNHHIIAQSYNGTDDSSNLIPNTCRSCHDDLESGMTTAKGLIGAGRDGEVDQNFMVGNTQTELLAGSVLLDEHCQGLIEAGSPIFGMRCHDTLTGEKYIEVAFSGGEAILITGSPPNSWVVYAVAR